MFQLNEEFYSNGDENTIDNSLQEWCYDRMDYGVRNNPDLGCRHLGDNQNDDSLIDMLNDDINEKEEDELKSEIIYNRRTLNNLKKFVEEKTDLSNEKNYEILILKEKDIITDIYYAVILLVIAILASILFIYKYFTFRK